MARLTVKRRRDSKPELNRSQSVEQKHLLFAEWSRKREVEIHNVQPRRLPGRGIGLAATQRIKKGDRVLFIPESAMFKPDFIALRQRRLERASSQAKLALSALLHFANDSHLSTWRETWPTVEDFKECMPMYWNVSVSDHLPSSARRLLERQLTDYDKDWQACQSAVTKAGYSEDDFRYYWMIVNSRSFHWAPPRGGAGYMLMVPFIDYMNHGPTGRGCQVFQRSDGYEVIAERDYEIDEELLFSYGAHPNEKLLVHYGFMLPYSIPKPCIDDEIRIDDQIVSLLSETVKQQLFDVGYLGPYALVPSTDDKKKTIGWEPCFKTQVALRATILTCNEWEFFASNGEDMSGDSSEDVAGVLVKALQGLAEKAEAELTYEHLQPSDMAEGDFIAAAKMVNARWQQISGAVQWCFDKYESG